MKYDNQRGVRLIKTNIETRGYAGNNVVGKERRPSVASVEEPSTPGLPLLDERGNEVRHPNEWFTRVLSPQGHIAAFTLTNGSADLPVRPLYKATPGTYQHERMMKCYLLGFLVYELGCLRKQLHMTERYGIRLVDRRRIVANELLERAECTGECTCFAIEQTARRSRHEERERQRAEEISAMNPERKTQDALELLAKTVTELAVSAARKKGKTVNVDGVLRAYHANPCSVAQHWHVRYHVSDKRGGCQVANARLATAQLKDAHTWPGFELLGAA